MVRGTVVLPHGLGKSKKVLVIATGEKQREAEAAGADFVGGEEMVEKIQKENWTDFDALIATALLIGWLTAEPWPPWYDMLVLMFQREVAERIVAKVGDDAYGRLAVLAGWRCEAKIIFDVAPSAFVPAPNVTSAGVRLIPPAAPPAPATEPHTPSARFRSAPSENVVVMIDSAAGETIATGDGVTTTFQLTRTVAKGTPYAAIEPVYAFWNNPSSLTVGGVAKATPADYSIAPWGVVTFTAAPVNGSGLSKLTCSERPKKSCGRRRA